MILIKKWRSSDGCAYSTNRKDKLKEHKGRAHKAAENSDQTDQQPAKKRPSKLILNIAPSKQLKFEEFI